MKGIQFLQSHLIYAQSTHRKWEKARDTRACRTNKHTCNKPLTLSWFFAYVRANSLHLYLSDKKLKQIPINWTAVDDPAAVVGFAAGVTHHFHCCFAHFIEHAQCTHYPWFIYSHFSRIKRLRCSWLVLDSTHHNLKHSEPENMH